MICYVNIIIVEMEREHKRAEVSHQGGKIVAVQRREATESPAQILIKEGKYTIIKYTHRYFIRSQQIITKTTQRAV
jgi:hypothetical protein